MRIQFHRAALIVISSMFFSSFSFGESLPDANELGWSAFIQSQQAPNQLVSTPVVSAQTSNPDSWRLAITQINPTVDEEHNEVKLHRASQAPASSIEIANALAPLVSSAADIDIKFQSNSQVSNHSSPSEYKLTIDSYGLPENIEPQIQIPNSAQLRAAATAAFAEQRHYLPESTLELDRIRPAAKIATPGPTTMVVVAKPIANYVVQDTNTADIESKSTPLADELIVSDADPLALMLAQLNAADSAESDQAELSNIGSFSAESEDTKSTQVQFAQSTSSDPSPQSIYVIDSSELEPVSSFEMNFSKQLLGLFVDDEEQPALIAAHDGDEYLLPLVTILESVGASIDPNAATAKSIRVNTPGGPAEIDQQDLRLVDGQVMITETALAEKLMIEVNFDQSSFALYLELPWSLNPQNQYLSFDIPDPDFVPPTAAIRNMRSDLYFVSNDAGQNINGEYFFAGNLAGGGWRFRAEQLSNGEAIPS
ncbi:MAG: hypothetical protein GKR91_01330 [Pseudomonadales bacterium]|nr:hypothetical protein [Pseudomonadales bacterium]